MRFLWKSHCSSTLWTYSHPHRPCFSHLLWFPWRQTSEAEACAPDLTWENWRWWTAEILQEESWPLKTQFLDVDGGASQQSKHTSPADCWKLSPSAHKWWLSAPKWGFLNCSDLTASGECKFSEMLSVYHSFLQLVLKPDVSVKSVWCSSIIMTHTG